MGVTLRTKPIQGGKLRLYLDYYPALPHPITGKQTRREFLSLFVYSTVELTEKRNDKGIMQIYPTTTPKGEEKRVKLSATQRHHNDKTFELAENIQAQRVLQIQNEDYGFLEYDKGVDFLPYFKAIAEKVKEAKGDYNYFGVYNYLYKFSKGALPVNRLTPEFCEDFKEYLLTAKLDTATKELMKLGTAYAYFVIFKYVLSQASGKGSKKLFKESPCKDVPGIPKATKSQREYLTLDELRHIKNFYCDISELKNACLFSALTGLRHSDVEKMLWKEVLRDSTGHCIRFVSEKTSEAETMPISNQAFELLGERKGDDMRVFPKVKYSAWQNELICRWMRRAGIAKHITFHCFRHTYAVLQLEQGTPIYTLSKMMGHANVNTTQIYAKITNPAKREAAGKITL